MSEPLKERFTDPALRRMFPIGAFNSWSARPLSAFFVALRWTPNAVSVLSLLVSLAGAWLAATAHRWSWLAAGALMVHVGLLLDHADGQVARRTGQGSTWGMYLDYALDRIVEMSLIVALLVGGPVQGAPAWMPSELLVLGGDSLVVVGALTAGAVILWRNMAAYNALVMLRTHLMETGRLPAHGARPSRMTRRPLVPWVFGRDWVLLFAVLGLLVRQFHATLVLLLLVHCLAILEKVVLFWVRHREPEGDAATVLQSDFH